jgi:hypothetical protein
MQATGSHRGIASLLRRSRQNGATALEFGLTFPVFFMVFWAILHFGLVFTARLTLQHAAEEGAREALRSGPAVAEEEIACGGIDPDYTMSLSLSERLSRARNASCLQANWLAVFATPTVDAVICSGGEDDCLSNPPTAEPDCVADGCQIAIRVSYPYDQSPIIPALPGFGLIAPQTVSGTARTALDDRVM